MKQAWNKLDNAAKIFPSAATRSDTQVFRFTCELKEAVRPNVLQNALDETMQVFSLYRSVLKRGMFWYYLEESEIHPVVREEYRSPCSPIYDQNRKKLLFEVTYYGCRVHLEIYHVLSDGTGAMQFLRLLVIKYVSMCYHLEEPALDYDASQTQMGMDSFAKYYEKKKTGEEPKTPPAYQLRGARISENRIQVITGKMKAEALLQLSRKAGATITEFVCACLIQAIGKDMAARAMKKPVVLAVPVNLRNYFPSQTARNFFSLIFTGYRFQAGAGTLEDILQKVKQDFQDNLTPQRLEAHMNSFSAVEHNVFAKIAPLPLKDICLKYAYLLSARNHTAAVSNIGKIKLPEEIAPFVKSFEACTGTNTLQACLCSFGGWLTISFTSPLVSTEVQREFFRLLTTAGISVEITANPVEDQQEANQ